MFKILLQMLGIALLAAAFVALVLPYGHSAPATEAAPRSPR